MDMEPPIPARSHRNAQRRSINGGVGAHASSSAAAASSSSSAAVAPANPEVISNLISSLSVISKPAESHFQSLPAAPSMSPNRSPTRSSVDHTQSSFGVDYNAYTQYLADDRSYDPASLDEIAATSPVVRTSKPPSGYSSRSAAHSTSPSKHRSPSRESGRAARPLNRSANTSRPSSPGSINDDARSIGNLSIERGSAPTPELRHRRSHDSWGKKTGRATKNLMYMSSKERLRDRDHDRKWAPGTNMAVAASTGSISSIHSLSRPDPFLAQMPISEEPTSSNDVFSGAQPQPVPTRESSLRKSGHKKRSSGRRSIRDSRDADGPLSGAIPEGQEYSRNGATSRSSHKRGESDAGKSFLFDVDEYAAVTQALDDEYARENNLPTTTPGSRSYAEQLDEEGAPSPSIANGRRQYERHEDRINRASGSLSPNPGAGDINGRRSNSRMKKRLSAQMSPRSERSSEHSDRPNPPAGYERPTSADSVDDAVESYLCSPRLSQKIQHPQTGRTISFSEVGDPEGSAVFCCVGMGLTRYITAFYDELALTLKLRLITPDRPGVGGSEPYSDGTTTPLSWPDDVYAICQALKITKFSILAHSAGAIYALATALRMPQHIRGKIHLLAPWIPPSQMNVFGASQAMPPTNAIPTSQRILRALPTPLLKAANSSFMSATSASLTSSLPKNTRRTRRKSGGSGKDSRNITPVAQDKENVELQGRDGEGGQPPMKTPDATENMDSMHLPQGTMYADGNTVPHALADKERQLTYDMRLTHAIWDLATTGANPAVDLLVCLERRHTIGFRYVDITRPVVLHHGSKDNRVPVDNVKWLGKTMRRCEVRVLEGEGHGLMASAAVMGSVLMEMSKEWDDWMRVTGADGRKDRDRARRNGK